MPRPKRPDFNPPADLLGRLPGKPIITLGDKLAALNTMFHRCEIGWRDLHLSVINAIREDIRLSAWRKREQAQRDSAPVQAGAPSKADQRSEAGSSIPDRVMERKIEIVDGSMIVDLFTEAGHTYHLMHRSDGSVCLYKTRPGASIHFVIYDALDGESQTLAAALTELAGDLRQDANARAWSQDVLATTTE